MKKFTRFAALALVLALTLGFAPMLSAEAATPQLNYEWIFEPTYDSVFPYSCGRAWARLPDGRQFFIDTEGKPIVEVTGLDFDGYYYDDMLRVKQNGYTAYIDLDGNLLDGLYEDGLDFSEGLAAVRKGGKWGYIDKTGAVVIPFKFTFAGQFVNGYAKVYDGEGSYAHYGFIDKTGKLIYPIELFLVGSEDNTNRSFGEDGLAIASKPIENKGTLTGFINTKGEWVVEPIYDDAEEFSNGYAIVEDEDGRDAVIDTTGAVVVDFGMYGTIFDYDEYGYAYVYTNEGKTGYIDAAGNFYEKHPHALTFDTSVYSQLYSYDDFGVIWAKKGDYWGLISDKGEELTKFTYEAFWDFSDDGYSVVRRGSKWGYVHFTGAQVTGLDFYHANGVIDGVAPVENADGLIGFIRFKPLAYPTPQSVLIDGQTRRLDCYALYDENGYPTNYVKLRDLALLLDESEASFEVDWDGAVQIYTDMSYTENGSEFNTPFNNVRAYTIPSEPTYVDGVASTLESFKLTDDNGGGYTYYKLRDLGRALGFNVGYSHEKGVYIETDKPYTDEN